MSFDWNLSSDEEEETQEWRSKVLHEHDSGADGKESVDLAATVVTPLPLVDETTIHRADSSNNVARMPTMDSQQAWDDFSEEEDEEEIDWEDADDDVATGTMEEDYDAKMPARDTAVEKIQTTASLVPVTIDMDPKTAEASSNTKKRKRPVSRKLYRFRSLPPNLQSRLLHIHRSHLLSLTSRAVQLSRCCSDHEVLHVAHSLVAFPQESPRQDVPMESEVRDFVAWYTNLVNNVGHRRRQIRAAHVAQGAPTTTNTRRSKKHKASRLNVHRLGSVVPDRLLQVASYVSPANDEHPHLVEEVQLSNQDKTQLFLAMARSNGWRARYVSALDPIGFDLDVNHPLFLARNVGNVLLALSKGETMRSSSTTLKSIKTGELEESGREFGWIEVLCRPNAVSKTPQKAKPKQNQYRWMHVDPSRNLIDQPTSVETLFNRIMHADNGARKAAPVGFALAVEHIPRELHNPRQQVEVGSHTLRLTDVTPRYVKSWSQSLQLRSPKAPQGETTSDNAWWAETLKVVSRSHNNPDKDRSAIKFKTSGVSEEDPIEIDDSSDDCDMDGLVDAIDRHEKRELRVSAASEAIPTSKAAFNNHPVYAIPSVLNVNEVFAPDAKTRICGIFKGVPVFRRSDVHTALPAKKWLYKGRKVKDDEMSKPVKRVKARKKQAPKGFRPLRTYGVGAGNDGSEEARQRDIEKGSGMEVENDGMQNLYAAWQTLPWSPVPVDPNDPIPVNEYNNVELELLNPGLVHLDEPRVSQVAKKLGIPYAPCLLGFEGHGGNRTPSIRGIVVHEHSAEILREAHSEFMSSALEKEYEDRMERIRKRWKKLIVGVLTKERLEREYG